MYGFFIHIKARQPKHRVRHDVALRDRLTYDFHNDRIEVNKMNARKKLNKLCVQELNNNSKSYDEAFEFMKKFICIYEKCKPDKKYISGLSHYDFMYWVNPIRETFAENDYKKAVEKLIDIYMEQNDYLYQSRVKVSIMILLRQYVNSEREK